VKSEDKQYPKDVWLDIKCHLGVINVHLDKFRSFAKSLPSRFVYEVGEIILSSFHIQKFTFSEVPGGSEAVLVEPKIETVLNFLKIRYVSIDYPAVEEKDNSFWKRDRHFDANFNIKIDDEVVCSGKISPNTNSITCNLGRWIAKRWIGSLKRKTPEK